MALQTLLPIALLFLAISHNRHCCAQAMTPKSLSSFPSTFVTPKAYSMSKRIPASYTQISIRRRVACHLSQHAEDEDGSFFIRASQQAAQQRMQQLKAGQDPLAISLSSPPSSSYNNGDVDDDEGVTPEKGGYEEEVQQSSESPPPEVKIPMDPFRKGQRHQETIKKSSQSNYNFQRKLLETQLVMGEKAKLTNAGRDLETTSENQEADADTITQTLYSSVDLEEAIPNRKFESNITITDMEADTTNMTLDPENETIQTKSKPATSHRLSSDGKAIFEPSPSRLEMNQENVDMGLIVLTQTMLTLKFILDRED